ncbi:MAG: fasciclin domain-containing protein [Rudaea sp.]
MINTPKPDPTRNLLDTAADNGTFETFGKAVASAGLDDTLRGPGPYTLLAPTDAAFAALPEGKLESLMKLENKAELVSILNYHVLVGARSLADIGKWPSARTVHGQAAQISSIDGKVSVAGAHIVSADIASSNGVIHGIVKVNLPTPTKHGSTNRKRRAALRGLPQMTSWRAQR